MAGTFANRKVARAARAGGSSRRIKNRSYGFNILCLSIIVLGIGTVWFSRDQRLGTGNYGHTAPVAPIPPLVEGGAPRRQADRWFESVGFYTCDKYAPNINVADNPYGTSTSNDGVIHIVPTERKYAGHNVTLGLFAKTVGLKIDRTSFQLPGDPTKYDAGTKCNGKDAQLVIKEWTNAGDNNTGKQVKSDPASLLLEDNHALTVAWVPVGMDTKDIPLPPSAATLAAVKAADASGSASTTPTSAAGETTTTAPGTPSTTTTPGETTTTAVK